MSDQIAVYALQNLSESGQLASFFMYEEQEMSLDEWLCAIMSPTRKKLMMDYEFPSNDHRDQYLCSIGKRADGEVRNLLRFFLLPSGVLGGDERYLRNLLDYRDSGKEPPDMEFQRRLLLWGAGRKVFPWEGITWVLDLLPHSPRLAIETIESYLVAHCQVLPDGRMNGLSDAVAIIRAKYILEGDVANADRALDSIGWRELEVLSARLYQEMGYEVVLTPARGDGGRDVIAKRDKVGMQEYALIQCKKYSKLVGPAEVRELFGVVSSEKANKGIVVTTSRFTPGAEKFAKQNKMELVGRKKLITLLNEHLGSEWPVHISYFLEERFLKRNGEK